MSGDPRRGHPRIFDAPLGVAWRMLGDEPWGAAKLLDISLTGASISLSAAARVGQRLELHLTHTPEWGFIDVVGDVLRVTPGDATQVGVRFTAGPPNAKDWLMAVLTQHRGVGPEEAVDGEGNSLDAVALSSLRPDIQSIYEILRIDPTCDDGALESRCEGLIVALSRTESDAVGRRQDRLRLVRASVERLRPLWTDPLKRARYDLRWGYVRAEERLHLASAGAGLPQPVLAAIWAELHPKAAAQATAAFAAAAQGSPPEVAAALARCIELEPFAARWRRERASPSEPQDPRHLSRAFGKLGDVTLRRILISLSESLVDAEVDVLLSGAVVGLLGVTQGELVFAFFGEQRGVDALASLLALTTGEFRVRPGAPREDLVHMSEAAGPLLSQQAAAPNPGANFALQGNLATITLSTVFAILEMERKTGRVDVERSTHAAVIWFRDGMPVRAEAGDDAGLEVVYDALDATEGTFRFSVCLVEDTPPLAASTLALLLESARRRDERSKE